MVFGINIASEEYKRRETEYVSDLSGVAVIADDHLIVVCGNTMKEAYKIHDNTIYASY